MWEWGFFGSGAQATSMAVSKLWRLGLIRRLLRCSDVPFPIDLLLSAKRDTAAEASCDCLNLILQRLQNVVVFNGPIEGVFSPFLKRFAFLRQFRAESFL
jgi:hypothetical protein